MSRVIRGFQTLSQKAVLLVITSVLAVTGKLIIDTWFPIPEEVMPAFLLNVLITFIALTIAFVLILIAFGRRQKHIEMR